jgi:23S rRNA (adenine2503-C2)-methyltransferase
MIQRVRSLADYGLDELGGLFASWGFPKVHAQRLLRLYYAMDGRPDLSRIPLPVRLRERIDREMPAFASQIATCQAAEDGTQKLLVRMADGALVESVLMLDHRGDRAAGCLSSQVGCAMACSFCATGQQGFTRNLSAGEMVEQFLHLRQAAEGASRRLRTVVLMGMGEPLLNLANVLEAVQQIAADGLGHLGWRQVTVSTVGLVPQMRQLTAAGLGVHLAVSLHAPDDELRAKIIPVAQRFPLAEVMDAAQEYQEKSGRIVILQYCLLDGVNDSPEQAEQLVRLLNGRRMHVNLLMYNTTGANYRRSADERVDRFVSILRGNRVVAHVRRSRGKDIAAACGQLRGEEISGSGI